MSLILLYCSVFISKICESQAKRVKTTSQNVAVTSKDH